MRSRPPKKKLSCERNSPSFSVSGTISLLRYRAVAVNASRWVTAQIPPHLPAPEIVCANDEIIPGLKPIELQLPASRRLPADTVEILQSFYDFGFLAWANPGDRAVLSSRRNGDAI